MQPKSKTPWGRYITITVFIVFMSTVLMRAYGRSRAADNENGMQLLFYESDGGGSSSKPGSGGGSGASSSPSPFTTANEFGPNQSTLPSIVAEGSECNDVSMACFRTMVWTTDIEVNNQLLAGKAGASNSGGDKAAGALGQIGNLIAMAYTPPASGVYYLADAASSFGLATPTYAQGYGYFALAPFLRLWRIFRNVVYMIFTIMIIVIALMILFRQKIGSQASVTAQQALPRIIIALVLVSFSYAIAGFLIDLMYWLMFMVLQFINIEGGTTMSGDTKVTKMMLVGGGFGDFASILMSGRWGNVWDSVQSTVESFMTQNGNKGLISTIIGWMAGGIVSLIFIIVMLFNLFRLFLLLLKSYASILLYTIFSPFYLMLYAIPGTNSFSSWVKRIVANLSPFFITFIMLVMVGAMNYYTKQSEGTGFVPPYILAGGAGNLDNKSVGVLVSLAIMLVMPDLVSAIKNKLSGGPGFMEQNLFNPAGRNLMAHGGQAVIRNTMGAARWVGRQARGYVGGSLVDSLDRGMRRSADREDYISSVVGREERGRVNQGITRLLDDKAKDDKELQKSRETATTILKQRMEKEGREGVLKLYEEQLQKAGYKDAELASLLDEARRMDNDDLMKEAQNVVAVAGVKNDEKRNEYRQAVEKIRQEKKLKEEERAGIRRQAAEQYDKFDELNRKHFRRYTAEHGLWKSLTHSVGMSRWMSRRDANEDLWNRYNNAIRVQNWEKLMSENGDYDRVLQGLKLQEGVMGRRIDLTRLLEQPSGSK